MKILQTMKSMPTQDGDGVNISRVADFNGRILDPFLMIDELKSDDESDYIGGFPPHPHRGIETFTYMIKGGFEHQDQLGNKEIISDGHVQWMSTGFGVVHSEMPIASDDGMHGFQIWINMAAKDKLRPARYQDSIEQGVPEVSLRDGGVFRALAGEWQVESNKLMSSLNALSANAAIADVRLPKDASTIVQKEDAEQLMLYVHTGSICGYEAGSMLVIDPSEAINIHADEDAGALIFSGNKLREPVAHMGPFVMNTQEELMQAVEDYRQGKFGALKSGS